MKKTLLSILIFVQFLMSYLFINKLYIRRFSIKKIQLSLLFSFVYVSLIGQTSPPPHTFSSNGTFLPPAGITLIDVQAWGAGGSGGAASATALNGRSGGGGGGGAYARGSITVIPRTSLNVLVAPQTLGTNGDGSAGGSSTIQTFETMILAAGGAGGKANVGPAATGGTPAAPGGTVAASKGTTRTAGGNGTIGGESLLGLALSSGSGGAGANPSGGAGGVGFASLALSSQDGRAGNIIGGGGAGAISSSSVYKGGAGARGQVVITYTCPTYTITSGSALSTCVTSGTAQVTLISTAAGLPIGDYIVSYTRSIPAGNDTALMNVSSAGTGTFTVTGLTTAGTSVITVNKLTSGKVTLNSVTSDICSTDITTGNINVTVAPATVAGTVTGGTAICSGGTSATLSLTGQTGSVIKWQSDAGPFGAWIDISNTNTTYVSDPLFQTTRFRAVVQSGTCIALESAPTTVTVNPLPTITLGNVAPVCTSSGAQTTLLNYTAVTESPTNYSITWNSVPANSFAPVTDASLPSQITIAIPAGTLPETYTGTLKVKNANGCSSSSVNFNVVVNDVPQISLGTVATVCADDIIQTTTLNYTAVKGSPTKYSLVWNSSPPNTFAVVTDAVLPSQVTITVPANTAPGTYAGTLTTKNDNSCFSNSVNFNVVVNARPSAPTLGAKTQSNCVTPTGSLVLNNLPASATWTITQSGTFPNSYSGTGSSYLISNLAPGSYTFTTDDGVNCTSQTSNSVVIDGPVTNIWNGISWSKGSPPINTDAIVFSADYSTLGNVSGCSCVVNSGVSVTVNANHTLTIVNSVSNNGGTLIFENNSSLLQSSDAVNSGDIIYRRNTLPVRRYDQTYWSSPVTRTPAFTLRDLSPNTLADKYYRYDAVVANWVSNLNGTDEMEIGIGYNIRAPQSYDINLPAVFNGVFTGVPNNGPVSIPLGGLDKWALIGNPYPSAVYADQFIVDNQANIYGTLYFWTHNSLPSAGLPGDYQINYNSDDYALYNLTGTLEIGDMIGSGATTPGNQSAPLGYIAAGQAFFVKSKTTLPAVFTNSMRVPGSNSQFYKTNGSEVTIEKHRVWLNLTNTQGAFKQLLIGYVTGATNFWDNNYDGLSLDSNKYIDFYSINDNKKLVIQGRAVPFEDSDTVSIGYRSALAGSFTIAIDHTDGELSTRAIYLKDKITGDVQDLTVKNYTFNTEIGTFNDRFMLSYGKTLGIEDIENVKNNVLVSVKNKIIKLTSNSNNENLSEVTIFDVSGKILYNKKKIGSNELEIVNLKSGDEVLIVKTTLENGNTIATKIVF